MKSISKTNLQARMTIYVGMSVLIVSLCILTYMASLYRDRYEEDLNTNLDDAIASTTQIIKLKMEEVEGTVEAIAKIASPMMKSELATDSMLCHALRGMQDVKGVSMVRFFQKPNGELFYRENHAYYDDDNEEKFIQLEYGSDFEDSEMWTRIFEGEGSGWSRPFIEKSYNKVKIIDYFAPINNTKGKREGMIFCSVLDSQILDVVVKYKTKKDIDVCIVSESGDTIVGHQDYIKKLPPERLITKQMDIKELGWRVIFTSDRNLIDKRVHKAILIIIILIVIFLVVNAITIILVVRYVAKPFVRQHEQVTKAKTMMEREMTLAEEAQRSLLPQPTSSNTERSEISLDAFLLPARKVGGDMYDYFIEDDKLYLCIGDVSGKGVPASLFMAATHYLFRSVASVMPMVDAVRQMNRSLCTDNKSCMFVTFWFGCLDLKNGMLTYVNAGHNPPIYLHGGKGEYMPMPDDMPLGVWEEAEFTKETITLSPDDLIYLYTDGVTEAMNFAQEVFGNEKTLQTVEQTQPLSSNTIIQNVLLQVKEHAGATDQSDDITMVCVKYK